MLTVSALNGLFVSQLKVPACHSNWLPLVLPMTLTELALFWQMICPPAFVASALK
jgi:hypothetical protein